MPAITLNAVMANNTKKL